MSFHETRKSVKHHKLVSQAVFGDYKTERFYGTSKFS